MKHFVIQEFINSAVARQLCIDNTPDKEAIDNLNALIENVLEPAREQLAMPIRINSGYRCALLNKAVGGVPHSQHLKGEAADVTTWSVTHNRRLYEILLQLPFDQLIWERGNSHGPAWIHVSYRHEGNRGEVLRR